MDKQFFPLIFSLLVGLGRMARIVAHDLNPRHRREGVRESDRDWGMRMGRLVGLSLICIGIAIFWFAELQSSRIIGRVIAGTGTTLACVSLILEYWFNGKTRID